MTSEADTAGLLRWTRLLTGLEIDAVATARNQVADWNIPHLCNALMPPTIDAAVSAFLLVTAVERLAAHGADRSRA